ncbi:PREDICTED: dipeptidyl peptidase 9-like isoform X2 [Priapulus caudatus]|uniref:Dipeptidyl peptidase 9-like isoform X2 n=1 Tax=Priapulus caudatus TaxID=37621 RepID=A0ABM1F8N8_PRICU|nr:PREDICTED: dipeptidyl peptidase 9-like isoform X2 [Priapulus caudatus]
MTERVGDGNGNGQPMTNQSWNQLREAARDIRRQQTAIASRVPSGFVFRAAAGVGAGAGGRIYFLGVPKHSRENTIMYVDVPAATAVGRDAPPATLPWKHLLDSFQATPFMGQYSKEEQLLRERKRLGMMGITSFDVDMATGKFVFPACNSLFFCTDGNFTQPMFPTEIQSVCIGARMDPKICPTNPDLVAFIHNGDIWVTNTTSGCEKRITHVHKGGVSLQEDPMMAGVPSFVVQEEFDRYTGHWWQPCSQDEGTGLYRILYELVDESDVEILHIVSPVSDGKGIDEYRYPKAGTPNARCSLRMLIFRLDSNGQIRPDVEDYSLVDELCNLFPWMEYIVRVNWTPDGQFVWVQLLSRRQDRIAVVLVPLSCFCKSAHDAALRCGDAAAGAQSPHHQGYGGAFSSVQVLYEETSECWINVHDLLHFLHPIVDDEVTFIWASEESGFRHLYRITSQLQERQNPTSHHHCHHGNLDLMDSNDAECLTARVTSKVALTSGAWEVNGKQLWVDELCRVVYLVAYKDSPLETHLYAVSYDNPSDIVRLTAEGCSHHVAMDTSCGVFVTLYSSVTTPAVADVYSINAATPLSTPPHLLGRIMEPTGVAPDYQHPHLFNFTSQCGHEVYGMVYRPCALQEGVKYPAVLFVYGGPEVQLVTNSYKGVRFLRLQMLASLGYVVVVIDNRGSAHRGLAFEGHLRHRMGTVEIDEHVEGLQWLANHVDYIDQHRVAIHGWSYGGYLSLMGLAQRPDVFKVAIAGAPVTSWEAYDTGYTERYMDTPQNNPDGYKSGSVLEYASLFPNE